MTSSQFYIALPSHLAVVRHLLQRGRHVYKSLADEDLLGLINTGICVIGEEFSTVWGVIGVALEERPLTLPPLAPNRAALSAVALLPGHWPSDALPELVAGLAAHLPKQHRPVAISAYGHSDWLERGLLRAGFELSDRVMILALNRLKRHTFLQKAHSPALLETPVIDQLAEIAELDALAFEPLWHFSAQQLWELLLRGRMCIAIVQKQVVGYAALQHSNSEEAQLARLAVHPQWHGQGIGRQLLVDALRYAQSYGYETVNLNTQVSNQRSQALYKSLGFRSTGHITPILTKLFQ